MIYTIILVQDLLHEQEERVEIDKCGNTYMVVYTSNKRNYSRFFPDMVQALECLQRMVSLFATGEGDTEYRVKQFNR